MNKEQILSEIEIARKKLQNLEEQLKESENPKMFRGNLNCLDEFDAIFDQFKERHNLDNSNYFEVRTGGEYAFNGIYLGLDNSKNEWVIVTDREGLRVLTLKRFVEKSKSKKKKPAKKTSPKTFKYKGKTWKTCDGKCPQEVSDSDILDVLYKSEFEDGSYAYGPEEAGYMMPSTWKVVKGYRIVKK